MWRDHLGMEHSAITGRSGRTAARSSTAICRSWPVMPVTPVRIPTGTWTRMAWSAPGPMSCTRPSPTRCPKGHGGSQGNEIGDECAQTFGPPLGSTDPSNPSTTEYNQVINGGKYYLQTLFSDYAYATYGLGKGCAQSEAQAHPRAATAAPHVAKVVNAFVDPTPIALPADGTSKSTIVVTASDKNGNGVPGDHVHLSVGLQTVGRQWPTSSTATPSPSGLCGTLSNQNGTTDANGN